MLDPLTVISTEQGLQEFVPEWRCAQQRVPPASVFQTPEWLLTWWSHFGSGDLHVIVFRTASEPIGVIPAFLHQWNGRRQCTLIGSGLSDYLDPLLNPSHSDGIMDALQRHLETSADWDVCDWQDLSADTPLRALGPVAEETPCARIDLPPSFDDFLAARPHGLKRNLRRYREKAEAVGPLEFAVATEPDPVLLDALIDLHRVRWQRSGQPGMIDSNRAEAFLRDVAVRMAALDALRIFTLRFQHRVAAIILAWRHRGAICSYLSAFDPEYERFGCGRELLACALHHACLTGHQCWDFLRGAEPYKFDWGARLVPKSRLVFEQRKNTRPMP